MKTFLTDLFLYHHQANQKLIQLLISEEDKINETIIYLLSHSINAHQIWLARITNSTQLGVHELHTFEKSLALDTINHNVTLTLLEAVDLKKEIYYKSTSGVAYKNTIEEILFHVTNHFTHHRAQIMSQLRNLGIEPLATDYIYYKREPLQE